MNHPRWKHFLGGALIAVASSTTAHAADLFSYAAIRLPYEPRYEQPWGELITTQEQWQAFYTKNFTDFAKNPPQSITAPSIDFGTYRVVVGGLGSKTGFAFSVVVNRISEAENEIYLEVLDVGWGLTEQACGAPQIQTYPYLAVLVKKSDKPIKVNVVRAVTGCK